MDEISAIDKAIQIVGSQKALADEMGVTKQAVHKWRRRVPAERVIKIESITDGQVSRHELRPDLYPIAAA